MLFTIYPYYSNLLQVPEQQPRQPYIYIYIRFKGALQREPSVSYLKFLNSNPVFGERRVPGLP